MTRRSLADLREEMLSVARGERQPSPVPAAFAPSALHEESLALLKAVAVFKPANVSELAGLVGKAQSNVSRSLQRLAKQGLLNMVREGREVRPQLVARYLTVDLVEGTVQPDKERAVAAA